MSNLFLRMDGKRVMVRRSLRIERSTSFLCSRSIADIAVLRDFTPNRLLDAAKIRKFHCSSREMRSYAHCAPFSLCYNLRARSEQKQCDKLGNDNETIACQNCSGLLHQTTMHFRWKIELCLLFCRCYALHVGHQHIPHSISLFPCFLFALCVHFDLSRTEEGREQMSR